MNNIKRELLLLKQQNAEKIQTKNNEKFINKKVREKNLEIKELQSMLKFEKQKKQILLPLVNPTINRNNTSSSISIPPTIPSSSPISIPPNTSLIYSKSSNSTINTINTINRRHSARFYLTSNNKNNKNNENRQLFEGLHRLKKKEYLHHIKINLYQCMI